MRKRKYTIFCHKLFSELTREEMFKMRRGSRRIQLERFIEYYGVTSIEYSEKIRELGLSLLKAERELANSERVVNDTELKEVYLSRKEMIAVRLFRGYNRIYFAKKSGISEMLINSYEKGYGRIPKYIKKMYLELLEITPNELKRIRLALAGEIERLEEEREIPRVIKGDVFKRDKGQCVRCGGKNNLHYHHIKRFANGGLHSVNNIIILCVSCHAEEHKGELGYFLLKNMAGKLEGGEVIGREETKNRNIQAH